MAAAAIKTTPTTRFDIEKKFREEFGRDLTPEEKRLLGWAEIVIGDSKSETQTPAKENKRKTA